MAGGSETSAPCRVGGCAPRFCTGGPGSKMRGRGRAAPQTPAAVSWPGGLNTEMWLPYQAGTRGGEGCCASFY